VYTVLYDAAARSRVKEYRYDDTPIGNGGVAPTGGKYAAINYGSLARLRAVTGYPGALDWSQDEIAPDNDGIFLVDIETEAKNLLVSYKELWDLLVAGGEANEHTGLFINHTLWNRTGDMLYFFVRANWDVNKDANGNTLPRIDVPCSIRADGTGLTIHSKFIGGHPEWGEGNILFGEDNGNQVIYDIASKSIIGQLGTPEIFPDPEGDVALSPDGTWFVNGHVEAPYNYYTFYSMNDGSWLRSDGIYKGEFSGDIRIDPAPRWNRSNNAVLVPGITDNGTRQMFIINYTDCYGDPACPSCGNTVCDPGEDRCNCPADCGAPLATETDCTDGIDEDCDGGADCDDTDCNMDSACMCGNGTCDLGEDCTTCTEDCISRTAPPKHAYCCGDGTCEGIEDSINCAVDCGGGSYCDDGTCDPGEDQCSCPEDCGAPPTTETNCTDGIDEDCDGGADCDDLDCLGDPACPSCGDATCDPSEDQCNCPKDCGAPPATETNCTDGIDEDCDGGADCDDLDCLGDSACDCAAVGEACEVDADCCSNNCFEKKGYCKN
jgi:hypothetical protein